MTGNAEIVVTVRAELVDEDGHRTLTAERTCGMYLDSDVLGADVFDGYSQSLLIAGDTVTTMMAAAYPHRLTDCD